MTERRRVTAPTDRAPRPADDDADRRLGEVVELVKTYAKQETLGPLKGAGRWLASAPPARVLLGLGLVHRAPRRCCA